jgi:hypothetical protein
MNVAGFNLLALTAYGFPYTQERGYKFVWQCCFEVDVKNILDIKHMLIILE